MVRYAACWLTAGRLRRETQSRSSSAIAGSRTAVPITSTAPAS